MPQKYQEGCRRFFTDPQTLFPNNEAERTLGEVTQRHSISSCFHSMRGTREFANLRTVIVATRTQGWKVLETLAHPISMQLTRLLHF